VKGDTREKKIKRGAKKVGGKKNLRQNGMIKKRGGKENRMQYQESGGMSRTA